MNKHPRVERGEVVAHAVLTLAFRVACFVIFAPVAVMELARGNMVGACLAAVLALVVPTILAPHRNE